MHRSDLIIILTLVILSCSSSISFPTHYSLLQDTEGRELHRGQISQPVGNARASRNGIETKHLNTDALADGSGVNGGAKVEHQARMGAQMRGEVRALSPGGKEMHRRAIGDDFEAKFVLEAQKRAHNQDAPAGGSGVNGGAKVAHQARMGAQMRGEVRASLGAKIRHARAIGDDFEAKFVLEAQKRAHNQ